MSGITVPEGLAVWLPKDADVQSIKEFPYGGRPDRIFVEVTYRIYGRNDDGYGWTEHSAGFSRPKVVADIPFHDPNS